MGHVICQFGNSAIVSPTAERIVDDNLFFFVFVGLFCSVSLRLLIFLGARPFPCLSPLSSSFCSVLTLFYTLFFFFCDSEQDEEKKNYTQNVPSNNPRGFEGCEEGVGNGPSSGFRYVYCASTSMVCDYGTELRYTNLEPLGTAGITELMVFHPVRIKPPPPKDRIL